PLTKPRIAVLWVMGALFAFALLDGSTRTFFDLDLPRAVVVLAGIGLVGITGALMFLALRVSGWMRHVPDVVRVTQERVREGGLSWERLGEIGFSWERLRAWRSLDLLGDRSDEDLDGSAGVADTPADPQLALPFDEQ
ncbi:MAG: hypothetical protein OEM97_03465, partial [Acidimicrobiia bacterium]|nr:hypothetical protein [Acidimicrobiia bacterium]